MADVGDSLRQLSSLHRIYNSVVIPWSPAEEEQRQDEHRNRAAFPAAKNVTSIGGGAYSADTAIAVPLLKVVRLIM